MSRVPDVVQRQAVTAAVFAGVAVGLAVIVANRPIRGAFVLGAALIAGGTLRAVLSDRHAGMLVNRGRTADALTQTALGIGVIALAVLLRPAYSDL